MLKPILISAVIAFLVVLVIIYFKEIKTYLLNKFPKKSKAKQEKPKEKKDSKTPQFTVEDFKPINNNYSDEILRDESLEKLFEDDDLFNELENSIPTKENNEVKGFNFDDEFADFNKFIRNSEKKDNKTVAQKIKELPPEIKALLIDNVLKKRDDV